MWGTDITNESAERALRFIPTHVGNGEVDGKLNLLSTVHPHACGERTVAAHSERLTTGSSPRMWGTGAVAGFRRLPVRFIPTHVGNGPTPG